MNAEPPKDIHLTHLDLFSGVGMFSLAARWAGVETVAFSEVDPYAAKVLAARFPGVRNLGDIRKLCRRAGDCVPLEGDEDSGEMWCPLCDASFGDCACIGTDEFADNYGYPTIITAGFPCQDVSANGKGAGLKGARSGLVTEALRVTDELRPVFLTLENVAALRTRGADELLAGLEARNYAAEPFVVGSRDAGAYHGRKRAWIVAYDKEFRMEGLRPEGVEVSHTLVEPVVPYRRGNGEWEVEPDLRRVADGNANWMDRLACIGNAIQPQIPVHFFDYMRDVLKASRKTERKQHRKD